MKIAVIGHPCLDIIHQNEKQFQSFGGIIYSLIGFLIVAKKDDEIFPVFQLNQEYYQEYFELIDSYDQIKLDFVRKDYSQINIVHLFFFGEQLNFECYQTTAPKIEISKLIKNFHNTTHFYINMISGFEIELDDFRLIRKNSTGKIYFDFHTLTRGINEEGRRIYRPLENWKEWVKNCDVIQLNEIERENLTKEKFSEEEFSAEALKSGCKVVNITKGSSGATSYFIEENEIKKLTILPEANLNFKSNVGCGDIFGAVFAYYYFSNESIETCLREAIKISSRRIEIEKVENIIRELKR